MTGDNEVYQDMVTRCRACNSPLWMDNRGVFRTTDRDHAACRTTHFLHRVPPEYEHISRSIRREYRQRRRIT